ncbi:MAG: DUF1839 family protein [Planctomycetaceae bacterium]|nr:DUF1839 family protein [Planctomycetaceae bacterium]
MTAPVISLSPAEYQRHLIHTQDRTWAETNCYVDVWIELLHAWGFEPLAAMPFTIGIDFEGDQWTFFKFSLGDLRDLYGLDVQELAIWQPLAGHVEEQIRRGRPVLVELDSYYLPDTAGTAYRIQHQKSTVAVVAIDVPERRLGYFHGQGYYELAGDDFTNVFRMTDLPESTHLPPYVEFVKRRSGKQLTGTALVEASVGILRRQLQALPAFNPFVAFKSPFAADLDWLVDRPIGDFHAYSFATLRQFGSCYELAATYLKWLQARDVTGLEAPVAGLTTLSTGAKSLQFNLARAVARKKPLNLSVIDEMAAEWDSTMTALKARLL